MHNDELDLMQVLKIAWKNKKILIVILVISIILGCIYSFWITTPRYQSSARILIDKTDASITEFVQNDSIMIEVAKNLNLFTSGINESVMVNFDKATKIISISANSINNEEAYNIVKQYQEILKTKLEETYDIKTYNVLEQAQLTYIPYNIDHVKDIIMFFIVGALLSCVYCILVVIFSGEKIYNLLESNEITFLGKIDKEDKSNLKVKSYISNNNKSIIQLKKIMANIELNKKISRPKTILVTSPNYGTGTTYIVSNLAFRYSKIYEKVLIIDSNLKKGIEHEIFNIESKDGLTDLIERDDLSIEDIRVTIKQSPINNIYVLPIGDKEINEELLISEKIQKVINLVKNQFDIIIIDGEPILKQITSYGWANIVNAVVIVAEYAKTKIEDIMKAKNIVEDIDGKVSGVIVNKAE